LLPDLQILRGPYLQDILQQPAALGRTLDGLSPSPALNKLVDRIRGKQFSRIVLTGMGASFHALHPFNLQLIQQGYTALMVETSELLHYQESFIDSQTLMVTVSQSGRSAEIVRLLEVNQRRAAIIAITNTAESLLARKSDAAVVTSAGDEFSVSCKTYVCALLALEWLGGLLRSDADLNPKELSIAARAAASYLEHWEEHVRGLASRLNGVRHLFLVGRGPSLASAGTGALIIKESTHFHAEGMSSAAFRHGPLEMVNGETLVLAFLGDPRTAGLNRRLVEDICQRQASAELVSPESSEPALRLPSVPQSMSPILEILPVQMVTLALAALAGREPGRFALASKVTTTE